MGEDLALASPPAPPNTAVVLRIQRDSARSARDAALADVSYHATRAHQAETALDHQRRHLLDLADHYRRHPTTAGGVVAALRAVADPATCCLGGGR